MGESPRKQPTYAFVAAEILDAVERGDLAPGDVLRISHVALALRVSRTPVYHGVHSLAARGVVRLLDTGGCLVLNPDGSDPATRNPDATLSVPPDLLRLRRPTGEPLWSSLFRTVQREIAATTPFGRFSVNEARLAKDRDVSRTVVRDILTRLEQLGILEKGPAGHWVTLELSDQRIADLYEIRKALEPVALRTAWRHMSTARLEMETSRIETFLQRYPDIEGQSFDSVETFLHVDLLGRSTNRDLVNILSQTRLLLIYNHTMIDQELSRKPEISVLHEHNTVIKRLLDGSIDQSCQALHDHLTRSMLYYTERIRALRTQRTVQLRPYMKAYSPRNS